MTHCWGKLAFWLGSFGAFIICSVLRPCMKIRAQKANARLFPHLRYDLETKEESFAFGWGSKWGRTQTEKVRDHRPLWHLIPKCKQRAPSWSLENLSSGKLWEAMEVWHHPLTQGEKKFLASSNLCVVTPLLLQDWDDWLKSCFYPGSLLFSTVSQVLGPGVSNPSSRPWPRRTDPTLCQKCKILDSYNWKDLPDDLVQHVFCVCACRWGNWGGKRFYSSFRLRC